MAKTSSKITNYSNHPLGSTGHIDTLYVVYSCEFFFNPPNIVEEAKETAPGPPGMMWQKQLDIVDTISHRMLRKKKTLIFYNIM